MLNAAARGPRIAYIVFSHNLPEQLCRLTRMLDAAESTCCVLIHHDAKSPAIPADLLAGQGKILLVPKRFSVSWGDFSLVEALVYCLRLALDTCDFDWIIVLSGQDFPIRPLDHLAFFLGAAEFDAFVEAVPIEKCHRPKQTFARYYYRHWQVPRFCYAHKLPAGLLRSWRRFLAALVDSNGPVTYILMPRALPDRIGLRRIRTPFSNDLICYKGSDWLNLSKRAAAYLLRVIDQNPLLIAHYRHTVIPSESLYQTVLFNSLDLKVCPRNLRYIKWASEDAPSPEILTVKDLSAMIRSDEFFARKFDVRVDSIVLDMLEKICAGEDVQAAGYNTWEA